MHAISEQSYLIMTDVHSVFFIKETLKSAQHEARKLMNQFGCAARIYRIVLDHGVPVLVEESIHGADAHADTRAVANA